MNEPVVKLTDRWNDYLEQHKESARIIDGEQVQFIFHIHPGKQAKDIVREMGWMDSTRSRTIWTIFYVRNLFSWSSFHGNDERNSEENGMNWQS